MRLYFVRPNVVASMVARFGASAFPLKLDSYRSLTPGAAGGFH
jgi:hypothetical protein